MSGLTEKDMLLIMTVTDILGKKAGPKKITAVYERQKKILAKSKEEEKIDYKGIQSVRA